MTCTDLERRVGQLETQIADLAESREAFLDELSRHVKEVLVMDERLLDGINRL